MGGLLMGLANLVPGISGGTMLLAAGVYPDFIQAIADLSRFRFHTRALVVLAVVGGSAVVSILLGAGLLKELVLGHRWIMYSLFIGLTLGGVPVVWNLVGRADGRVWGGAAAGFLGMAALAVAQEAGVATPGGTEASIPMMLVGGVAGASAMILPGVSGGYLLLVLGLYVPILTGIDAFKEALKAGDVAAMVDPVMTVVAPVGIGVVLGVVVVSNLVKVLLDRFEKATLGVLLGLLVGAVVGLWPFQVGVAPQIGDVVKGRVLTAELLADLDADDYPVERFTPTGGQAVGSLALIGGGIAITGAVAWIGRRKEEHDG
jgi:putative membrane protein